MGNRLLLADDSITIQKVVAIIFANEEFELTVVDNGTAALQKAREIQPAVMLVDALMPGMSGYQVCAEIRSDAQLCSTPILLLVGAFEPVDEEKARNCGADASISKPFESQQLIDRVKELLELGRSRAAAQAFAPVASPLPLESSAEELWGDLSSFDTMPASAAPAAPCALTAAAPSPLAAVTFETAPAAVAPPVAPVSAVKEPVAAANPAPLAEDIVEASYEDDLWGAFEMEELPEVVPVAPGAGFQVAKAESQAGSEFEAEEFFSFEDESEAIDETGPALDCEAGVDVADLQPSAEELFGCVDEEPSGVKDACEPESFKFAAAEPLCYQEEAASLAAQTAAEPLLAGASDLSAPPVTQSAPLVQPENQIPEAARSGVAPGSFTLSEADLATALSRISREVVERIVWEVVPDLAEVLIKEEIRKLKAGIRG